MARRLFLLLFLTFVFMIQCIFRAEAFQEEFSALLEVAQTGLGEWKEYYERHEKSVENYEGSAITDSAERERTLKSLQECAGVVSAFVKTVTAVSVLANVMFAFLSESPTAALHKRFDEVGKIEL